MAPSIRLPNERRSQESVHSGSSNVGRPREQGVDQGGVECWERRPRRRVGGRDRTGSALTNPLCPGGVASGR